jgi:hypothetical protein
MTTLKNSLDGGGAYKAQLAELLIIGASRLEAMAASKIVSFSEWTDLTAEDARSQGMAVTQEQLRWLWNALRTEPEMTRRLGRLLPAPPIKGNRSEQFLVLDHGESFVIGMKVNEVQELLGRKQFPATAERASVRLLGQLYMRHGKAGRLECCDVRAEVVIRPTSVHALSREADIMRIDEDDVVIEGDSVKARVKSLNQAYTVASRRLEPERRSHGGRIYDHLIYVRPGERMLLETIRQRVEEREWPLHPRPNHSD